MARIRPTPGELTVDGRAREAMDFAEPIELSLLREGVAGVAAGFGLPYFLAEANAGGSAERLWSELGRHGYLAAGIPEADGGGGLGITGIAALCEELAAAGCPLLTPVVSLAICASVIAAHGSSEQRARWLPALASGNERMAFALTEADAGSNVYNLATRAERHGDGYRIRGSKCFISGADDAAAIVVVARAAAGLALMIVPADATGLRLAPLPTAVISPERQFTLFFDDVEVSAAALIGGEDAGLNVLFAGLNPERIAAAAVSNGLSRFALARAASYARERRVWGEPIGTHQGIAHPLAEAAVHAELARLMTARAAWLHDSGADAAEAANMAKLAAAEAALECLDRSIQTHGGSGLAREVGLADLWGIARLMRSAPVSREMILNFVAQHSLGLPRSYHAGPSMAVAR
jgi:alkylation response protein AidB-like acyl-CoA dehydrogenase